MYRNILIPTDGSEDRYIQTAHVIKAKGPLQDRKFALALPNAE